MFFHAFSLAFKPFFLSFFLSFFLRARLKKERAKWGEKGGPRWNRAAREPSPGGFLWQLVVLGGEQALIHNLRLISEVS